MYNGHLYGIDESSRTTSFVHIENNSTKYDRLINLGEITISGPSTATKSLDNQYYLVTCHISLIGCSTLLYVNYSC